MLILLFISMLFVSPLLGYVWIWKKADWRETTPDFGLTILSLFIIYAFPIMIASSFFFGVVFFISTAFIWGLMLFWGLLAPMSAAVYVSLAKIGSLEKRKIGFHTRQKRIFLIGFLILVNLLPISVFAGTIGNCYYQSLDEAQPLIQALEAYHAEHGIYPESFDSLVSGNFIDYIPPPNCQEFDTSSNGWSSDYCSYSWAENGMPEMLKGRGSIDIYLLVWFAGGIQGECF